MIGMQCKYCNGKVGKNSADNICSNCYRKLPKARELVQIGRRIKELVGKK